MSSKSCDTGYDEIVREECKQEPKEEENENRISERKARKLTIDGVSKHTKSTLHKSKKKVRKSSGDEIIKKFESLMNAGGDMEIDMRLMDSKLTKINKAKKKKIVVKSIMKVHDVSKKPKPKTNVAFDLKHIEYI